MYLQMQYRVPSKFTFYRIVLCILVHEQVHYHVHFQVQLNCNLNVTLNLNLKCRCAFRWTIKGTLNCTDILIIKWTIK